MQARSKNPATVFIVFALIYFVSPFPDGGNCDSLLCWNAWDVLEQLGNGFSDLKSPWPPGNTFQLPPEPLPGTSDRDPVSPPLNDPQIEILEVAPSPDTKRCSPEPTAQRGAGCKMATIRLVFPLNCQDVGKNAITEQKISGMDQQYKRVLDPACSVADGVFFWKGRFTDEQAQSLRGDGLVKAIITNVKAEADRPKEMNPGSGMKKSKRQIKERQTYNSAEAGTLIPQFKSKAPRRDNPSSGHGIDRRDPMKVWRREVEDVGLNYLSTAPGKVMKRYYTYGIDAGKDVLVIVLDTGFPSSFVDIGDQNRILSRNTANLEATPNGEEESFGACTVEKIGGIGNGVAWHTQFALFEVTHDFDNFLQALASIDSKLDSKEIVPSSNGAVMNIRLRYIPISTDEGPYFAGILKWRMKPLIAVGIIIVTSAGASQSRPTDVITSYPAKLARDLPIVSVGFVDPTEASEPIGPHGNGVSVFAPYLGKCHGAMPEPQYFKGAGVAVATVTGLVAYYLSLAQLKDTLKTKGVGYDSWDWVRGVYAYIRRMGYERGNWAEHAVWNGHDNDDVGLWYGVGPLPEGAFW